MKKQIFLFSVIFLCVVFVSSCKSPSSPPAKPFPVINSFFANPSTVAKGDYSTLEWSTTNATSTTIDQGVGQVTTTGSTLVDPEVTTTYTLTATGEGGSTQATSTIEVRSAKLEVDGNIKKTMTSYDVRRRMIRTHA